MANRAIDWSERLAGAVETAGAAVLRVERRRHGASATVWDAATGLVVTTAHAVGGEERARLIAPDGSERDAEVVGRDPGCDLALLRTDPAGLSTATWRELDGLKVGHATLAVARPGRSVRASLRIIGVLGPEIRTPWGGRLDRYVETDRALPRGFSGGPLVDLDGQVLGMNTSGLLRGADVAVPTATVRRVVGELAAHGSVRRGYLGVAVQRARLPGPAQAALGGQDAGALVVRVEEGSPAASAGLVLGDVVVSLAASAVNGPDDLREIIADRRGSRIEARIVRVGALVTLEIDVGEQ